MSHTYTRIGELEPPTNQPSKASRWKSGRKKFGTKEAREEKVFFYLSAYTYVVALSHKEREKIEEFPKKKKKLREKKRETTNWQKNKL